MSNIRRHGGILAYGLLSLGPHPAWGNSEKPMQFGEWTLSHLVERGIIFNKDRGYRLGTSYCIDGDNCALEAQISISCVFVTGASGIYAVDVNFPSAFNKFISEDEISTLSGEVSISTARTSQLGQTELRLFGEQGGPYLSWRDLSVARRVFERPWNGGNLAVVSDHSPFRFQLPLKGLFEGYQALRSQCGDRWRASWDR